MCLVVPSFATIIVVVTALSEILSFTFSSQLSKFYIDSVHHLAFKVKCINFHQD